MAENNGLTGNESSRDLMMIAINDIRENRKEINGIKEHLMKGEGKICANREAIDTMKNNMRDSRTKSYIGSGGITLGLNAIIEVIKRMLL